MKPKADFSVGERFTNWLVHVQCNEIKATQIWLIVEENIDPDWIFGLENRKPGRFFFFFFLWTWNNELENVAHSVLSFYFQLTKRCIQNTGTVRLAVTNKIKNKSRKPHSDHVAPRGRCRLVPWTSSGFSSGFSLPPAEVRMESHDQLVVILSYFETDDRDN